MQHDATPERRLDARVNDRDGMKRQIGNSEMVLAKGDITTLTVDAIVNAANKHLQHGGGVALAIVRRGGPSIQEESDKLAPIETGQAVITSGGKLPAKWVIHTVGPVWGEGDEENKLRKAITNSLKLADDHGLHSIAFPAVSAGIYRFPLDRCAQILIETATAHLQGKTGIKRVIFCLFDDESYQAFETALNA